MLIETRHEPVSLIFERGYPIRFVFAGQRWVVNGKPVITDSEPCPPEITHGHAIVTGYRLSAQTEEADDVATFEMVRVYRGWEIKAVQYA